MMKPKVCITTVEYPPDLGGVGQSVYRIANGLANEYEIHAVVMDSSQSLSQIRRPGIVTKYQDNVFVHRLISSYRYDFSTRKDFFFDMYQQLKLLHQKFCFDLFHSFYIKETGFVTTLLAKEFSIPVICSVRGSDLHYQIFGPEDLYPIAWSLSNATHLTFVSVDLLNKAECIASGIKKKSKVIYNSIDKIDFQILEEPDSIIKNKLCGIVIGTSGRLREKKGIEFLLDACSVIKDSENFTLLLIGDFIKREKIYWNSLLESSGLGDRIIVTGMLERVKALSYLPVIDIFAIPSLHDGCPNALLEAMMAEKAIICSKVDAMADIMKDRENAIIVNPASSSELTEALLTLIHNPSLRLAIGKEARRTVLNDLTPEREMKNWLDSYHLMLKG